MSIMVRTVAINAAFFAEVKEDDHELQRVLQDLERIRVGQFRTLAQFAELTCMLHRLRDQLAFHFSLEEAYGYFDDPLDVPAHLCAEAERLRTDHVALYEQIADLAECAEGALRERDRRAAAEVLKRTGDFQQRLELHESHERVLILDAYQLDLGVGD